MFLKPVPEDDKKDVIKSKVLQKLVKKLIKSLKMKVLKKCASG